MNSIEEKNPLWRDMISEIRYERKGLVVLLREDSLPVYLGSAKAAPVNFERFVISSNSIEDKRDNLKYIDARYEECLVLKHKEEKWTS